MTPVDLALALQKYGILTASHAQHCARSDYKRYDGGDLPACTCHLHEIQAEVKNQLNLEENVG